jgi:hypothetical protein
MTKSQAEYFSQNVKHDCCRSVRRLGNASTRAKWHFLECTLNSKLNTEITATISPSCVVDISPVHEELPAPRARLRVRDGIITVQFEQLEAYLSALQAVQRTSLNEERLYQITITYR